MSSDGLSLRGVTVAYDELVAVDGVDLDVAAGEIVALLGPSGCGKTTLLRAVAGLEPLQRGEIRWQGDDIAAVPTHRRGIGMMFQHHALFPHRNVGDNVAFGLRMQGRPGPERARRVAELLELVGLGGYEGRAIDTLSGGQAQRVALARALAPQPRVLLLDEPLASLDRALRDRLVGELRHIIVSLGITAVHVTHDQDEAAAIADRIVIMFDGRIHRQGRFDELVDDPGDTATARFLGLDNVWVGPARAGAADVGRVVVDTPVGPVGVDADPGVTAAVVVPPGAIEVGPGAPAPGRPEGIVESIVRHGDEWKVRCRLEHGAAAGVSSVRLEPGTRVVLGVDPTQASTLRVEPDTTP